MMMILTDHAKAGRDIVLKHKPAGTSTAFPKTVLPGKIMNAWARKPGAGAAAPYSGRQEARPPTLKQQHFRAKNVRVRRCCRHKPRAGTFAPYSGQQESRPPSLKQSFRGKKMYA